MAPPLDLLDSRTQSGSPSLGMDHQQPTSRRPQSLIASATTGPARPGMGTRKISLSKLAMAVLNFENKKKRASKVKEEELLQAAEQGDVKKVKRFFLQVGDLNANCTDPLGRTPLQLAVANEQKEVVEVLLDYVDKRCVFQALLLAINVGHDEIAETIVDHPKYSEIADEIKKMGRIQYLLSSSCDEMITPLVLAAQRNRYEVVTALLMKGEIIEKPHKYYCPCTACSRMAKCDELKFAKARLNTYKGLASEAYISLSSEDPILTSFNLRRELRQVAAHEKYYMSDYSSLSDQLGTYVVRLLDRVNGNEELNTILNTSSRQPDDFTQHVNLARLQLAIEYKEKKFVAHSSCQKKLTTLWYAEFQNHLKNKSWFTWISMMFAICFFYPLWAVIYLVAPGSSIGKLVRTPCIKFVAQATSFTAFLCLILLHSFVEQTKLCTSRVSQDEVIMSHFNSMKVNLSEGLQKLDLMCLRSHSLVWIDYCVSLWVGGLLWGEVKRMYTDGPHLHFRNIYNCMDFCMLEFYISSLTLRYLTDFMVFASLEYYKHRRSWLMLVFLDREALYRLYWLNADRYYWDSWDPYHVCEALFALGNILNFARLFQLLAINEHLGPMLISLERMIKDVMKFMVTFVPIFMAFMVGMYNMYWYYEPTVRKTVETMHDRNIVTKAEKAFGNLEYTFRSIYWALFGLSSSNLVELNKGYDSWFTERVGYIVFGVYHWGAVIVLLNMLIAMMTRSFEKIATDQDIEWKFTRSHLYMEYIRRGSTLPVPFNLIPSPKCVSKFFTSLIRQWCSSCQLPRRRYRAGCEPPSFTVNGAGSFLMEKGQGDPEMQQPKGGKGSMAFELKQYEASSESNLLDCADYKTVIKRVVRRYISAQIQAGSPPSESASGATNSDGTNPTCEVDAIKQEISVVQEEVASIQPCVQEQFRNMKTNMDSLTLSLMEIHRKLEQLLHNSCDHCSSPPMAPTFGDLENRPQPRRGIHIVDDNPLSDADQSFCGVSDPQTLSEPPPRGSVDSLAASDSSAVSNRRTKTELFTFSF